MENITNADSNPTSTTMTTRTTTITRSDNVQRVNDGIPGMITLGNNCNVHVHITKVICSCSRLKLGASTNQPSDNIIESDSVKKAETAEPNATEEEMLEIPQIPIPVLQVEAGGISAQFPARFASVASQCDEFYTLDLDESSASKVELLPSASSSKPSNEVQISNSMAELAEHNPGQGLSQGIQQLLKKYDYRYKQCTEKAEEEAEAMRLQEFLKTISEDRNPDYLEGTKKQKKKNQAKLNRQIRKQLQSQGKSATTPKTLRSLKRSATKKSKQTAATKKYVCKSQQLKLKFKISKLKSKKNLKSKISSASTSSTATAASPAEVEEDTAVESKSNDEADEVMTNAINDDAVDNVHNSDLDLHTDTRGSQPVVEISRLPNSVVTGSHSRVQPDSSKIYKVKVVKRTQSQSQSRLPRHNKKDINPNKELDFGVESAAAAAAAPADTQEALRVYECKICHEKNQDSTSRIRKLKDHIRVHQNPGNFTCKLCGKCFLNVSTVERHKQSVTHKMNLQAFKYRKMINKNKKKEN